jgi:hypothetical protein
LATWNQEGVVDRPYFKTPVEELEQIVAKSNTRKVVLAQIREELQMRTTDRAKQLLREVNGLLDGTVPSTRTPPPDDPDNQLEMKP